MDHETKPCLDCQRLLPLGSFGRRSSSRDGRAQYCKECFRKRHLASRERKAAAEGRALKRRREVAPGFKYCPACQAMKPIEDFCRNRSTGDGRATYCKPCHNAKAKETYTRLYGSTRHYHLKRRYGISAADFDTLLAKQGNVCAICEAPNPQHVDHDHVTGDIRGVLCFNCNGGLGQFRDDIEVLAKAINYLEGVPCPTQLREKAVSRLRSIVPARLPSSTS